jgi:O-6-methylguanine DNA methyltransferase
MIGLYAKEDNGVWFGVACDDKKIFATTFGSSREAVLQGLSRNIPFNAPFQRPEECSPLAGRVLASLKNVYRGKEVSDSFSLATEQLSNYARNVIRVVSVIRLGYVSSYGLVADVAGGSRRAVGHIMALNPFPPIVPCHRVVRSDFTLGGYGGGLEVKLAFLDREKQGYTAKREIPVDGKKLQLFPVEFVLRKFGKR